MVVGCCGWARSQFFIVCGTRSTLPQVVRWLGRLFFWTWRGRSSLSRAVAAAAAAGEPGGEHYPVVGQGAGGDAVGLHGCAEGGEHDRAGDAAVGAHPEQVAGAGLEPPQGPGGAAAA